MTKAERVTEPGAILWHGPGGPGPALRTALDLAGDAVHGPLAWQRGAGPGRWRSAVDLDRLEAGWLAVPSLVLAAPGVLGYSLRLCWIGGEALLAPIRVEGEAAVIDCWPRATIGATGAEGARADAGLDCVEALDDLHGVRLEVDVLTEGGPPRLDLVVSRRPRRQSPAPSSVVSRTLAIPSISQMEQDPAIARDLCSPSCVAMVLEALGARPPLHAFLAACEHPQHERLFGLWPWNLARAWEQGACGVVRTFDDARDAAHLLNAGLAIIASIRYETGALPGAPMPRSAGHLVVLRGLDARLAQVNDPAAADRHGVARAYDRDAFLDAWLADRGVGYVLWPRGETSTS